MSPDVIQYNQSQSAEWQPLCDTLARLLQQGIPHAQNKVWHGAPVWFLQENPIVGYWVRKGYVQLLFWSGQSFDEPELEPEGSFKAAQLKYSNVEQIDVDQLQRLLQKSQLIQWDYKNIVKRKGTLEKL